MCGGTHFGQHVVETADPVDNDAQVHDELERSHSIRVAGSSVMVNKT